MAVPPARRPHRWLIAALAAVIPRALRDEWRREWEAELDHYEHQLRAWPTRHASWQLFARSAGATYDVLWLQHRRLEDEMVQDIRFGFRLLRRSPAFAAAAIMSLAIGIGANTAVFTLISAALLRPLPYPDVDRIVAIRTSHSRLFSMPSFVELSEHNRSVDHLSAFETLKVVLGDGQPEQVHGQLVSAEFGALVGLYGPLRPIIGRPFASQEFQSGHERVVMLSHRLWMRRYGAAADIVGQVVSIDAAPTTIVGVLPARFDFFATGDLVMPLVTGGARLTDRFYRSLEVIGRLRRGVAEAQATAQIGSAITDDPGQGRPTIRFEFVRDLLVQDFKRTLFTLWAVAALVLLIGCGNFANLVSARTLSRTHELSVRVAIGAGRGRVTRQLIVEALVLAGLGGGLGLALAFAGQHLLTAAMSQHFLGASTVSLDWRVMVYAGVVALSAGLSCGVVPAVRGGAPDRSNPFDRHRASGSGRGLARAPRHGVSITLAVAQVGLTLVLLVGASLLVKSMLQLDRFKPGYDIAAATLRFELPATTYPDDDAVTRFVAQLGWALRGMPGVTAVGATSSLPLAESAFRFRSFTVEDGPTGPLGPPERLPLGFLPPPPPPAPPAGIRTPAVQFFQTFSAEVGPGFFEAMGVPRIGGRDFTDRDTSTSDPVAIVNRAFADRYWRSDTAVGKRLRMTPVDPWITVVGVVDNIRRFARDDEIRSELYRPFTQQGDRRRGDRRPGQGAIPAFVTDVAFVVRTTRALDDVQQSARVALASIDPTLPIGSVSTLQEDFERAVAPRRFLLRLFWTFAAAALLLAALGVYGVTAYLTRRRTREMAVRVALGASPRDIETLVVRNGCVIAVGGVVVGWALSLALSRFVQQYLYELRPFDPWIYGGAAGTLVLVVVLASYLPAHQAARLDPARALLQE